MHPKSWQLPMVYETSECVLYIRLKTPLKFNKHVIYGKLKGFFMIGSFVLQSLTLNLVFMQLCVLVAYESEARF